MTCCPNCNCIVENVVSSEAEMVNAPPYVTLAPSAQTPPLWPAILWLGGLGALAWFALWRKKG
jgi:hypothetical protein